MSTWTPRSASRSAADRAERRCRLGLDCHYLDCEEHGQSAVSDDYASITLYTVIHESEAGSTTTSIRDLSGAWQQGLCVRPADRPAVRSLRRWRRPAVLLVASCGIAGTVAGVLLPLAALVPLDVAMLAAAVALLRFGGRGEPPAARLIR